MRRNVATPSTPMPHLPPHGGENCNPRRRPRRRAGRALLVVTCAALAVSTWGPAGALAGPATTRLAYAAGTIVPIPAAVPHQEGAMIDSRIVPDLRWIAAHFPIYVSEGYSGPLPGGEHVGCHGCHVRHSDHYNGLAVDIVPLHWSDRCDARWRGVTRLARWAEPRQNRPAPPFRWVGYNGDAGHGCGNHLHLSWEHASAPQFRLAEWVEAFPAGREAAATPPPQEQAAPPRRKRKRSARRAKRAAGPTGGISRAQSGGLSPRGD
jgi:hypothetical protein